MASSFWRARDIARVFRKALLRLLALSGLSDFGAQPARTLLFGYLAYMAAGWVLLMMPFSQELPVGALDVLFIAASAVSTTGLVSVDPGASFTAFGEGVILGLIQLGGLGYMTIGSVALLAVTEHLSKERERTARAAFELPTSMPAGPFLRSVVLFTLVVEAIGAAILYPMFLEAGVEQPLWSAVFHSVSAFCTAGFSLFPTSLEAFADHPGILLTISALSLLGAMGFLIIVDGWRALRRRRAHLGFTTFMIVRITAAFLIVGTICLALLDPELAGLAWDQRLLTAFFQSMTASTTVGFNSYPIADLGPALIMILLFLMVVGASPAGTGGGIKTTAFAVLWGLVRSTLRNSNKIRFAGRTLPQAKIRTATATLAYYLGVLAVAMVLLLTTEAGAPFDHVLFEAVSALGTVGLSMGLTGDLTDWGKGIVIILMTAGRLGILTFGVAIAMGSRTPPTPH